jgi:poly(beta-D-mannuronate) lyase
VIAVRLLVFFTTLALAGLATVRDTAGAADLAAYRVTDPDASFFAVDLRRSNAVVPAAAGCPEASLARPVDYYVTMPAFYQDPEGWRRASQPLFAFEAQATGFAADYVRAGDPAYARCLVDLLAHWAERRALLAFDYEGNHGQAWYAIQWTAATAGLAYSIVRAEPSLPDRERRAVEAWLDAVATKQIGYPGKGVSCCNNHLYWRGLEAAIVGVVTGDDRLFQYGIGAYVAALESMNPDGSLPHEMARGARALHYQNFAILPLVFIAEIAARQGYDLYGLAVDGRDIHLAVGFLLRALEDGSVVRRYTGEEQDLGFIERRAELNWLEPYHRRFPGPATARWLARLRPLAHNWTGGPGTLYFAGLEAAPDRPNQALLATAPAARQSE